MALSLAKGFICEKLKGKSPFLLQDEEVIKGKTVLITGSNSGIGKAAVFEFAKRGAIVIMACRDIPKAGIVVQEVEEKYPGAKLILMELDLGDLASIRKCAEQIKETFEQIHILVNNAGCLYTSGALGTTKDGFEMHMGINYLGHFLFTNLLLDLVKVAKSSRIVFVGSSLHLIAELDLDDLMLTKRGYFGIRNFGPYANSKLALLYFAKELAQRLSGSGVRVYTLCPGYVKTDAFRNETCFNSAVTKTALFFAGVSPEEAVDNIIYCSISRKIGSESGKMYRFNRPWEEVNKNIENFDKSIINHLWEISEQLTGCTGPENPSPKD